MAIEKGNFLWDRKVGAGDLSMIKYICIDEYQDFSPLFYKLLSSIKKINSDINLVDQVEVARALKEFFRGLLISMGENAGFYFLKEVKDILPYSYESTIKNLGINLDNMQLEYYQL